MAITLNGTTGITTPDVNSDGLTVDSTTLVVDEANNRVGIGTSSPSQVLEVGSEGNANTYIQVSASNNTASGIKFRSDSSLSSGWDIGYEGNGNYLFFKNDVLGTVTERARIDSSGNLLVGTTSSTFSVAPASTGFQVQNTGQIWPITGYGVRDNLVCATTGSVSGNHTFVSFYAGGTNKGSITTNGSSTAYNTSSDYRLKEDWQPMTGASERVKSLKPVNFAWKSDGSRVDGFLAHEAQAVVPECVTGIKDAVDAEGNPVYQGIDQSKLVPLLTAALQEALTKIDSLETRIAALEAA